jgi:GT2 family glycosyltransferase
VKFSVIIATLGRPEPLATALASVLACEPQPQELIVVDGDERESARTVVAAAADRSESVAIRYFVSRTGSTRQRNRGLDAATGDVVVFVDDDVVVPADMFAKLAAAYADDPSVVGATGPTVEQESGRIGRPGSRLRRHSPLGRGRAGFFTRYGYPRYIVDAEEACDVQMMGGCFMTARREFAQEIRFDEELAGYGVCEDEDFSVRLSRHGRIRYLPDVVVEHRKLGFRSSNARALNRTLIQNRRYLLQKNFAPTVLVWAQFGLFVGALILHRLVNREWAAAAGLAEGVLSRRPART